MCVKEVEALDPGLSAVVACILRTGAEIQTTSPAALNVSIAICYVKICVVKTCLIGVEPLSEPKLSESRAEALT